MFAQHHVNSKPLSTFSLSLSLSLARSVSLFLSLSLSLSLLVRALLSQALRTRITNYEDAHVAEVRQEGGVPNAEMCSIPVRWATHLGHVCNLIVRNPFP